MFEGNKLKRIKDLGVTLGLLAGAKDVSLEIFIWRLVGGTKHLGRVKIESIRKARKDFCIIPSDGEDRLVQELMGSQNYIDFYIPESSLLFRAQIKQTDAPYRYYLHFPEVVAQVDRRKQMRLNVYEEQEVKVNFEKSISSPKPMLQHFMKNCFDVSSGGFSFFVSRVESKFFELNGSIPMVMMKAGNWSTKGPAEVVMVREVEPDEFNGLPYKVWRVSCRFSNLDQFSKKYLEKYIFERIKEELRVING